jgi:O-antigen/teichoic acid export membrane protein
LRLSEGSGNKSERTRSLHTVWRLARNFSWLATGQAVFRVVFFLLAIIIARTVSVENYATLTLMLTYSSMWAPVFNFGLGIVGVREMAQENIRPPDFISSVFPLKVIVSAAGLLLMITIGTLLGYGGQWGGVLILISCATLLISMAEFFHLPFNARERMNVTAQLVIAERSLVAILAGAAVVFGFGVMGFAWGYLIGSVGCVGLAFLVYRHAFGLRRVPFSASTTLWYARESIPLAITWFLSVGYGRVGVVILDQFRGKEEVALFNTAFLVLLTVQMGITVLMHAAFPMLSKAHKGPTAQLEERIRGLILLAFPIGVVLTVVLMYLASAAVPLAFGKPYSGVTPVLFVLSWVLPFFAINALLGAYLQAGGKQTIVAWVMGAGLASSLIFALPLASRFGALGAALGTVASEVAVHFAFLLVIRHSHREMVDGAFLAMVSLTTILIGASVIAVFAHWATIITHLFVVISAGVMFGVLLVLGRGPMKYLAVPDVSHREDLRDEAQPYRRI